MNLQDFCELYSQHPGINKTISLLEKKQFRLYLEGLSSSASNVFWSSLYNKIKKPILLIINDAEKAAYAYNDIVKILGKEQVSFLPSAYKKAPKNLKTEPANEILRADSLNKFTSTKPFVVISCAGGITEKVASTAALNQQRIQLKDNTSISMDSIVEMLETFKFTCVDFVYEPGQYSTRGSILDVFSYSNELPYRIDFFGDQIESIRTFDIEKQLSIEPQQEITLLPDLSETESQNATSIWNVIPSSTIVIIDNLSRLIKSSNAIYQDTLDHEIKHTNNPSVLHKLIKGDDAQNLIEKFGIIEYGSKNTTNTTNTLLFHQESQPLFHKNFDIISENLTKYSDLGYKLYISSDSKKQTDRIAAIFKDKEDSILFEPILNTVHEGFIDHDLKLCCYTDHQIFDRFHKFSLRSDIARTGKAAMTLKELNQFQIGDYVVHIDHGIGKFGGLLRTSMNGKPQEVIKITFQNNDAIYVSIHNLHRISKYKGKDGTPPRIHKLGGTQWERTKEKTKAKVKDIARDLIMLYAKRKSQKGFQFTEDSYLQQELEASFIYEDTPDQSKSTASIKEDMQSEMPMDRLICGDVGFGKTELAIRAAFKAATDGKQVAILVPTTVLALQHFKTFCERLKDFPVRIEYLSRAKKAKEVKEITKDLSEGKIDILIGTHKIVGKSIKFADLGLLIIDEEQKFGVTIKEKLKALKTNVDTLTLTATPIPRTLQFSLMGARDLSILTTPPPNRYPIFTEITTFDDMLIKDAILHEMDRNGQVFFINNRVQNLSIIAERLQRLIPDVRIAIAHGQMPTKDLEETIIDFIDYEYDVLLATTVVESGIDIPNVNTIIINNANHFGLSALHQLRGRVGRSNRKAYCYLITPEMSLLSDDARRRLNAIETFSDLGSGFNIAMQDLDIRGAGNILGSEQSGFITDLGYETYQKILAEALKELRDDEFQDLFENHKHTSFMTECNIESDLELLFPAYYIENISERMSMYRELDHIKEENGLNAFKNRLIDRFGKLPQEAEDLLTIMKARWIAQKLGIERLVLKNNRIFAYSISNENNHYGGSQELGKIIAYIQQNHTSTKVSIKDDRCSFTIKNINSANDALKLLQNIDSISI